MIRRLLIRLGRRFGLVDVEVRLVLPGEATAIADSIESIERGLADGLNVVCSDALMRQWLQARRYAGGRKH